jgi:hypothetical protein
MGDGVQTGKAPYSTLDYSSLLYRLDAANDLAHSMDEEEHMVMMQPYTLWRSNQCNP